MLAFALDERVRAPQETVEVVLDALPHAPAEQLLVEVARLLGGTAAVDLGALDDRVRRDRGTHAPEALHQDRDLGGLLEVAGNPGGAVTGEEDALAGEGREAHHDVGLELRLEHLLPVLDRDGGDESEIVGAGMDGGHVDLEVLARPVGDHRVAGLVHRDAVAVDGDELLIAGEPEALEVLRVEHVDPGDGVAAVLDRVDERLVDEVLDRRARRVRRHVREPVDLFGREVVLDLGEVSLVGADTTLVARVSDAIDAVDAARAQQGLVERLRHVGGHHDEHAVLRRRLRLHAEHLPYVPVDETAWLLEP